VAFSSGRAAADVLADLTFPPLDFTPPEAERVTLANGMTLYLLEDHELPVFDILGMVRTGSVYDPKDQLGLAGLTASVLRTGGTQTRSPEELNETLEFIAGSIESGMGDEDAVFGLAVMAKDMDLGIELLADVLMHPLFRQDKLDLARNQALEAIRRKNDDPNQVAGRYFTRTVYGEHPYANEPTPETLATIARDDLFAFHARYYRPDAIAMAVSGDFDRGAIAGKIESAFAGWSLQSGKPQDIPPVSLASAPGVYHVEKDINQTSILLGHLGVTYENPDKIALNVLNFILGGDFTARLMQEVRIRRGLAYYVWSAFPRKRRPGAFFVASATKSESTVEAIEVIRQVLAGLREAPPTDDEIDLAKNSIINSFIFAYTSNAEIARQAMWFDYYGYPSDWLKTYRDNVAAVTGAELLRVAREYLHPDALIVLTVGKEAAFGRPLSDLGEVTRIALEEARR
jgi:predicted Zn-dependent peptidase